ncbi:MAG TPA: IPT/TIG domain-containing protein [Vicinamibacterales bacterium]|nr:IPT/TIG domain-containing protein [Vicinamibacterales bacterium]
MPALAPSGRLTGVHPLWAVEGGLVTLEGTGFSVDPQLPSILMGSASARIAHASPTSIGVFVPSGLEGGTTGVRIEDAPGETAYIEVGVPFATGVHQVDNPAFDRHGNLYVTFSGARGQQSPVSIFIVRPDGSREPFVTGIANPTSLAFHHDGRLFVSSRFDGSVYEIDPDGRPSLFASDLGVACGLAFSPDGDLFVGDRTGSILRVRGGSAEARVVASLPASVAAFHLAFGPDGCLYAAAPTLSTNDVVYRVTMAGEVSICCGGFGRPQGIAFDAAGHLYVVDALAGASAIYRLRLDRAGERERILSGGSLIGLAFDPHGGVAVASSDTVYRLRADVRGLLPVQ